MKKARVHLYIAAFSCLLAGIVIGVIVSRWPGLRIGTTPAHEKDSGERATAPTDTGRMVDFGDAALEPTENPAPTRSDTLLKSQRQALPDASVPLALQLKSLVEQARAGNPTAACRLVASVNRCVTVVQRRAFSDKVLRSLEKGKTNNPEMMIDLVARAEEQHAEIADYCDGVDLKSLPTPDDALRNALSSLDPHQKTVIAMLRSDGSLRRLGIPQPVSEPSTYVMADAISSNQRAFLQAGFEAKDPLALEGLIMMHSPTSAIMSQGVWEVRPNARLFLRYSLLMARLFGPASLGEQGNRAVAAVSAQLPNAELQSIGREVELEAQRWAKSRGISTLGPGDVLKPEPLRLEPLERCGE